MNDLTVMLVGGPQHGWDVTVPLTMTEYLIPQPPQRWDLRGAEGGKWPEPIPMGVGRYTLGVAEDGTRFGVWQGWH